MAMDYEIVATLGPGSQASQTWTSMLSAGVSAFRLNTSHLSLPQLHAWLDRLTPFLASLEPKPMLVLDLQGSKWRLGDFSTFNLIAEQSVELILAESTRRRNVLPVPHADFFKAALTSSDEIALNDARIHLRVEAARKDSMDARIIQGGEISQRKGITFLSSRYRQEALSEKDRAVFEATKNLGNISYAISYVKDAAEMIKYRELLGPSVYLIAKLERGPAVDEAAMIAGYADELWLCRGDLGAELGIKELAEKVFWFSSEIRNYRVPVLMAGQVLEHMTGQPAPTRSEVCYLYDALVKGYRGFVLSDETAIGRYPIEACRIAALYKSQA
jgi:pyruvate kinase